MKRIRKEGLCWRCESRAKYHETGIASRCECGSDYSVIGCYMYKPVRPAILTPLIKNDKRPRFAGAMISSREQFVRVAEGKLKGRAVDDGVVLYWTKLK